MSERYDNDTPMVLEVTRMVRELCGSAAHDVADDDDICGACLRVAERIVSRIKPRIDTGRLP